MALIIAKLSCTIALRNIGRKRGKMAATDALRVITKADVPNEDVRNAIILLHKERGLALEGVGYHSSMLCPMHCAYDISANPRWGRLTTLAQKTLSEKGWIDVLYDAIMFWYDNRGPFFHLGPGSRRSREEILSTLLTSDEVPFSTAA